MLNRRLKRSQTRVIVEGTNSHGFILGGGERESSLLRRRDGIASCLCADYLSQKWRNQKQNQAEKEYYFERTVTHSGTPSAKREVLKHVLKNVSFE